MGLILIVLGIIFIAFLKNKKVWIKLRLYAQSKHNSPIHLKFLFIFISFIIFIFIPLFLLIPYDSYSMTWDTYFAEQLKLNPYYLTTDEGRKLYTIYMTLPTMILLAIILNGFYCFTFFTFRLFKPKK